MGGITAAEYIEHLKHGLDVIDRHAAPRLTHKVWLTSALPIVDKTQPQKTSHECATRLLESHHQASPPRRRMVYNFIVEQFEFGMPLGLELATGDGVHLGPSNAHAVIVCDVLVKAGICPV